MARDPAYETAAHEEDRLPWLEAVDEDEAEPGASMAKLVALIVAALIALGLVIGGVWWLRHRNAPPPPDPTMIAAPEGDYKVKPEAPGGMRVEGRGDTAFATSEGAEATGRIDTNARPETPVQGTRGVTHDDAAGKPATATARVPVARPTTPLVAKPPATAAVPVAAGTKLVQLGAFGSQAKAEAAWSSLVARHAELKGMTNQIVAAEVAGSTVYRLRTNAGTNAGALCARLKATGANCLPVN